MVTVRIPAPPAGLLSNVVGLLGIAGICVAIAFLTDWRWGMLAGGVFLVALTVLAQYGAAQAAKPARVGPPRPVAVPPVKAMPAKAS